MEARMLESGRVNIWPDRRILDLFGIQLPIIQARIAGANYSEMVIVLSRKPEAWVRFPVVY